MINIRNLPDTDFFINNPELQREVTSYLLYCQYEIQQYADEDDDHDFNFQILDAEDLPMLNDLGPPEETVQISIKADGIVQTIYRIVYPTEVFFVPAELSDQVSF